MNTYRNLTPQHLSFGENRINLFLYMMLINSMKTFIILNWSIIPKCGHSPHEENTKEIGGMISDFLDGKKIRSLEKELSVNPSSQIQKQQLPAKSKIAKMRAPKMSSLVDKWSLTIFIMFVFVKILQMLKSLGFKAKESGWRKTMGTYLRTEHSKFGLAVFGLDFLSDQGKFNKLPFKEARLHVVKD